MKSISIFFPGILPSKKNGQRILRTKAGKPFIKSGQKHDDWHDVAMMICNTKRPETPIKETLNIIIDIVYPDYKRRDTINAAESILDVLVDSGILFDDNWRVVPNLYLRGKIKEAGDYVGALVTINY